MSVESITGIIHLSSGSLYIDCTPEQCKPRSTGQVWRNARLVGKLTAPQAIINHDNPTELQVTFYIEQPHTPHAT